MSQENKKKWSSKKAAELYGLYRWGNGYFDVSQDGNLLVKPFGEYADKSVSLLNIIQDISSRNLNLPVLLRFDDILASSIRKLNDSFARAINNSEYNGHYQAVYPIKVNQRQQVIKDIIEFGGEYNHGLETGSKAELLAAIAHVNNSEAAIVCNGYKDEEFLDLALHATKIGLKVFIVLEMPSELDMVLSRAEKLDVMPNLGIRVKLSTTSGGHWDKSSGDHGKFGLTASQMIAAADKLDHESMLGCLKMLHYHIGSQVTDITTIRTALKEAVRYYTELVHMGAAMGVINIGGGLAVDYTGSRINEQNSRNYSLYEYAADVVDVIKTASDEAGISHPDIISESGRSTVAHHSMLIFNVLHTRTFEPGPRQSDLGDSSEATRSLTEIEQYIKPERLQEAYNDAIYYRDQVRSLFVQGQVTLREKAFAEDMFWRLIRKIALESKKHEYVPDAIRKLDPPLCDVYYGNFSLFQSLPDAWAIDQVFPVMPIHRLNEKPERHAVIADITCDSDGMLSNFSIAGYPSKTLMLHELDHNEYFLAVFLVGAYQETLGDLHNLLGEINVVHVKSDPDKGMIHNREMHGSSAAQVLQNVGYNSDEIIESLNHNIDKARSEGKITEEEQKLITETFLEGMNGYTYFER